MRAGRTRLKADRPLEGRSRRQVQIPAQQHPAEAQVRLGALVVEADGRAERGLCPCDVAPLEQQRTVVHPPHRVVRFHFVPLDAP
jgi:hypothetical protein